MPTLTGEKRRHFRDHLELRLRRASGGALQALVSSLLARLHGDNFVPQCPWGAKGDLTCDGYLRDPQTIFACYGRENGVGGRRVGDIVDKVRSDYRGAAANWPAMKAWVFVSNIVDGVPAPVTQALEALQAGTGVKVGYFGFQRFEQHLLDLNAEVVEDLVGEIPVRNDFIRLQPEAVLQIVGSIAAAFSLNYLQEPTAPVPLDKLDRNRIPGCHAHAVRNGALSRETVEACLAQNADPSLEARVSEAFRARYAELRAQGFGPGEVMDHLHAFALAGQAGHTAASNAAAWAVLAYLFDMCSIFEDKPWDEAA